MMEKYIDIHTHSLVNDIDVFSIKNIILNQPYELVESQKYSVGLHPWFLSNDSKEIDLDNLNKIADYQEVVAIGEIGLDRVSKTDFSLQIEVFERQIELAEKRNLPIIIHCVRAFSDIILIKKKLNPTVPLIIHGYNQNRQILEQLINHQFYISIGAALLDEKSNAFQSVNFIPKDRLFFETDLSPISIEAIYKQAGNLLQITENELIEIIKTNYKNVFEKNRPFS